jgi:hypothetical protein
MVKKKAPSSSFGDTLLVTAILGFHYCKTNADVASRPPASQIRKPKIDGAEE